MVEGGQRGMKRRCRRDHRAEFFATTRFGAESLETEVHTTNSVDVSQISQTCDRSILSRLDAHLQIQNFEASCIMFLNTFLLAASGTVEIICGARSLNSNGLNLSISVASPPKFVQRPLGIHDLPLELVSEIASHLDFIDVVSLRQVRPGYFYIVTSS